MDCWTASIKVSSLIYSAVLVPAFHAYLETQQLTELSEKKVSILHKKLC